MADTLTLTLPSPLADGVRAAATAHGVSLEEYVYRQVAEGLASDDLDRPEDIRRLEEGGECAPLDEAFDRFKAKIAAARAKA